MNKKSLIGILAMVLGIIYAASPDFVPGPIDDSIILIATALISHHQMKQARLPEHND